MSLRFIACRLLVIISHTNKLAMEFFQLSTVLLLVCGRGLTFPAGSLEQQGLENDDLEETELLTSAARSRRSTSTSSDTNAASLDVSFTVDLPPIPSGECYGGSSAGLGDTTLRLDFRSNASHFQWMTVAAGIPIYVGAYNTTVCAGSGCVEFRLVQEEHGGGNCSCWNVVGGAVAVNGSAVRLPPLGLFCGGSASIPREAKWAYSEGAGSVLGCEAGQEETLEKPFSTVCSASPHINVEFEIYLPDGEVCNTINEFNEGVEFSIRLGTEATWFPIVFIVQSKPSLDGSSIVIGNSSNLVIRDYAVEVRRISDNGTRDPPYSMQICGFDEQISSVQLRWLQTSSFDRSLRDIWSIDNVHVTYERDNGTRMELLQDSFDGIELNLTNWPSDNLRNGRLSTNCTGQISNQSLVFGLNSTNIATPAIVSRSVTTSQLDFIPVALTTTMEPVTTTVAATMATTVEATAPSTTTTTTTDPSTNTAPSIITTAPSTTTLAATDPSTDSTSMTAEPSTTTSITTESSTNTTPPFTPNQDPAEREAEELVLRSEATAFDIITADRELNEIFMGEPGEAIEAFQAVVSERDDIEDFVAIYLLGSILNRTLNGQVALPGEATIGVASSIVDKSERNETSTDQPNLEGSSLLAIMDDFLFNHFDQDNFVMGNIGLQSRLFSEDVGEEENLLRAIDSDELPSRTGSPPRMFLDIPRELIRKFRNISSTSVGSRQGVRLGSFVYNNVAELFPGNLPGRNDTELGSGIVSTALQCGTSRCPTDDLELDTPVRVTIVHSETVRDRLERDNTSQTLCVFLEYLREKSSDGSSILSAGQWSDRNCTKNETLSNTSITVCECTHLTHFAILLSAAPLELSEPVTLSLEIIGYVGVSISLVAMAITVFTFIVFRYVLSLVFHSVPLQTDTRLLQGLQENVANS